MIKRFHALGWQGPYRGGKHPTMIKGERAVTVPNPHQGDIDWSLMKRVLQQADINPKDWQQIR